MQQTKVGNAINFLFFNFVAMSLSPIIKKNTQMIFVISIALKSGTRVLTIISCIVTISDKLGFM